MCLTRCCRLAVFLTVALACVAPFAAADSNEGYEDPPVVLKASEILPPELLKSDLHDVVERVENDGYMNHYRIESSFGEFAAGSDLMLRVRVQEIRAIASLREVSRTEAFAKSILRAVTNPLYTAKNVVLHPILTAKAIPSSVVRFFNRTSRQVSDVSEMIESETPEATTSEDPDGETTGEETEDSGESKVDQGVEVVTELGLKELGYTRAIREWAKDLGVDPYTDNEVLKAELDRVAWATALGGFATRLAPIPRVDVLDYMGDVGDLVWDLDPLDLRLRNEEELASAGFSEEEIKALYGNSNVSAVMMTILVDSVVQLKDVEGKEALVAWVTNSESKEMVGFFVRTANLFARKHTEEQPLIRLISGALVPAGVTAEGKVLLPLAVNYVIWSEAFGVAVTSLIEDLKAETESGVIELYLEGGCSSRAREELELLGATVHVQAFFSPPSDSSPTPEQCAADAAE